ncbi:MFS transporter protein [Rutstroemia sp. NJR-2017a WRK4]|nr:MFS transporter protein [Rutstroemia sp. NJR-2017a WRK4]
MGAQAPYDDPAALKGDEEVAAISLEESTQPDWTPEEERRVKRKIDFILLPILGLAFFALQMDRGNISNALTSTITEDLHVTTNQINAGTSILSAGIVLLEIPSNVLLQRIGPQTWLSFQILAWGLVATFQNFITNYSGYIVTRLLLGLCKAGFIPGALYTMSLWYKKSESSSRISIFFLGNLLASATVALIGAGILGLSGRAGVAGWRWLFIVEGIITITIGLLFILLLPPSVHNSSPLISLGKWSYFTPREHHILSRRVLLDDPAKTTGQLRISGQDIWNAVKKPRILVHVLISMSATIPVNAVQTYGPSIIKSLGFKTVRANAMASVGNFIAAVVAVTLGFVCDKTGRRGPCVLFAATWCLIAYACLRVSIGESKWRRYAAVVFSMATNSNVQLVIHKLQAAPGAKYSYGANIADNLLSSMIIMAANAAGIAGGQVFRTADAPLYVHAFTAMYVLAAATFVVVAGLMAWYFTANRRLQRKPEIVQARTEGGEIKKAWVWIW